MEIGREQRRELGRFRPAPAVELVADLEAEDAETPQVELRLVAMLERMILAPGVEEEEGRYLRDVHDHALRVQEQADGFRELLQNILSVTLTLETKTLGEVANEQNDQVKKISAWAAILFAPSMVGTVYGMNFEHMPELRWQHGYAFALALMGAVSLALYLLFKRRHWI